MEIRLQYIKKQILVNNLTIIHNLENFYEIPS